MENINKFSDLRLDKLCCYCGNFPNTRDHVPSKILLDEPFPENLPVVPCCYACNQGFSKDEEYVACLIECMVNDSVIIDSLKREKIKRILSKNSSLHKKLAKAKVITAEENYFSIEKERVENVLLKLARGHLHCEEGISILGKPTQMVYKPLNCMTKDENSLFFSVHKFEIFPEIGSRSFFHSLKNFKHYSSWQMVQEDIYSYMIINYTGKQAVRLVLSNFLAVEIIWDEMDLF